MNAIDTTVSPVLWTLTALGFLFSVGWWLTVELPLPLAFAVALGGLHLCAGLAFLWAGDRLSRRGSRPVAWLLASLFVVANYAFGFTPVVGLPLMLIVVLGAVILAARTEPTAPNTQ